MAAEPCLDYSKMNAHDGKTYDAKSAIRKALSVMDADVTKVISMLHDRYDGCKTFSDVKLGADRSIVMHSERSMKYPNYSIDMHPVAAGHVGVFGGFVLSFLEHNILHRNNFYKKHAYDKDAFMNPSYSDAMRKEIFFNVLNSSLSHLWTLKTALFAKNEAESELLDILDVGCGDLYHSVRRLAEATSYVKRRVVGTYMGIDKKIGKNHVESLESMLNPDGCSVDYEEGNINDKTIFRKIAGRKYDLINAMMSMHHILRDNPKIILELVDLLSPIGKLIVTVPSHAMLTNPLAADAAHFEILGTNKGTDGCYVSTMHDRLMKKIFSDPIIDWQNISEELGALGIVIVTHHGKNVADPSVDPHAAFGRTNKHVSPYVTHVIFQGMKPCDISFGTYVSKSFHHVDQYLNVPTNHGQFFDVNDNRHLIWSWGNYYVATKQDGVEGKLLITPNGTLISLCDGRNMLYSGKCEYSLIFHIELVKDTIFVLDIIGTAQGLVTRSFGYGNFSNRLGFMRACNLPVNNYTRLVDIQQVKWYDKGDGVIIQNGMSPVTVVRYHGVKDIPIGGSTRKLKQRFDVTICDNNGKFVDVKFIGDMLSDGVVVVRGRSDKESMSIPSGSSMLMKDVLDCFDVKKEYSHIPYLSTGNKHFDSLMKCAVSQQLVRYICGSTRFFKHAKVPCLTALALYHFNKTVKNDFVNDEKYDLTQTHHVNLNKFDCVKCLGCELSRMTFDELIKSKDLEKYGLTVEQVYHIDNVLKKKQLNGTHGECTNEDDMALPPIRVEEEVNRNFFFHEFVMRLPPIVQARVAEQTRSIRVRGGVVVSSRAFEIAFPLPSVHIPFDEENIRVDLNVYCKPMKIVVCNWFTPTFHVLKRIHCQRWIIQDKVWRSTFLMDPFLYSNHSCEVVDLLELFRNELERVSVDYDSLIIQFIGTQLQGRYLWCVDIISMTEGEKFG